MLLQVECVCLMSFIQRSYGVWYIVTSKYPNCCCCRKTTYIYLIIQMLNIKGFLYKTYLSKIPLFPITYNHYCSHSGKTGNNELEDEGKDSMQFGNHCILIGYSGSKYSGMQKQKTKDVHTIEGTLLKALLKSNWINQASYKKPNKIKFQEGSRTDKGVSATRMCCSILLPTDLDVQVVNDCLPDDIRLFGVKRVTDKFNARLYCMGRTYTYTLPTIAFSNYNDQTSQRDYRISCDKLKLVNDLLQVYKGSKNFHNFTVDREFVSKSCVRHMKHLECSSPFLFNDVEFCTIRIKGNSFMMHQLRHMIGLILAVIREVIDSSIFDQVFTESLINCPTAPGLGLVLDRQHYDPYDRKYGSDGEYETLTWEECDEKVLQFHEKYIQSEILQTEISSHSMRDWLETLLNYPYIPVSDDTVIIRNKKAY